MKTLCLSLHKNAFDVMVSGEKMEEYRIPSQWLKSRIVDKNIDFVKFTNGYGKDKPYFIACFVRWYYSDWAGILPFSNGFEVPVELGDIIIELGDIIEKGNLNE